MTPPREWLWMLFRPLIELSWAMQRRVDMRVLWPSCKELSEDLDEARGCFAAHALRDACWIDYYGEKKLMEFISALE